MSNTKKDDPFKDYVPEVVEYDPEVDGSDEHKIRDEHLDDKAKLLEKFNNLKPDVKNQKTQRKRKF
ncbi:MAG: hypothetical protein U9P71_01280 [Campylobacterota bacterium]|nr:hypothetical protein [Campylobacterota bacterium]